MLCRSLDSPPPDRPPLTVSPATAQRTVGGQHVLVATYNDGTPVGDHELFVDVLSGGDGHDTHEPATSVRAPYAAQTKCGSCDAADGSYSRIANYPHATATINWDAATE